MCEPLRSVLLRPYRVCCLCQNLLSVVFFLYGRVTWEVVCIFSITGYTTTLNPKGLLCGNSSEKCRTTRQKALAYRRKGGQNTGTAFPALRLGVQKRKISPKRKFSAGRPCRYPAKNFGQALQILEKQALGTDMPRGRPRKDFGLKNFGLIFRSLGVVLYLLTVGC